MTTSSLLIAVVIQVILFGGALVGMAVATRLPKRHLDADSRALVTTSMAVVGTLSALVIGLLISSGATAFRARNAEVAQLGGEIVQTDAALRRYGPTSEEARSALTRYAAMKFDDLFPRGAARQAEVDRPDTLARLTEVQDRILALAPADARGAWLKSEALRHATAIGEVRERLARENAGAVPIPFLGAVVLWLAVLFGSFGLFAPRHLTAVTVIFLCALSIASAVKLILDMDTPFGGRVRLTRPPIQIESAPLKRAVEALGR